MYTGLTDLNLLYDSFLASMKGSSWKEEPQRFEADYLSEIIKLKQEIESRTYKTLPGVEFTLNERGKIRHIHGSRIRDRVVRHALCDGELNKKLQRYLIYNNGASQKGKGIGFTRRMFERDLHNYWLKYRSNDGYIGFVDLSKFYDNVQHDKVREMILPKLSEEAAWLFDAILRNVKLSGQYKFLQIKYTLDDKGKVVKKINPKSVTRERKRIKAYYRLYNEGQISYEDIENACRSWMGEYATLMSKVQVQHMKDLYKKLFGKELIWKRELYLKMVRKSSQKRTVIPTL